MNGRFVVARRNSGLYAGDERGEWVVYRDGEAEAVASGSEVWGYEIEAKERVRILNEILDAGQRVEFRGTRFVDAGPDWSESPPAVAALFGLLSAGAERRREEAAEAAWRPTWEGDRRAALDRGRALALAKVAAGEWV
jgi:hypothetical protein